MFNFRSGFLLFSGFGVHLVDSDGVAQEIIHQTPMGSDRKIAPRIEVDAESGQT